MPATDQTRYNMKHLHRAFAASSIALLLVTVWMFVADHRRSWKTIQRTNDRIEIQLAQWRKLQFLAEDVQSARQRLERSLAEVRATELSNQRLKAFRSEIQEDARRRHAAAVPIAQLDGAVDAMNKAVANVRTRRQRHQRALREADKARSKLEGTLDRNTSKRNGTTEDQRKAPRRLKTAARAASDEVKTTKANWQQALHAVGTARDNVLTILDEIIDQAKFREDEALRQRKVELAHWDVAKSKYGIAVRQRRPESHLARLQAETTRLQTIVRQKTRLHEAASLHRERLRAIMKDLTADEKTLRQRLDEMLAEQKRLERVVEEKTSRYFNFHGIFPVPGKKWLELPVLDAFNSPRKIDNRWSEGLELPLGSFGKVRRFDRCTTCHQAIQKTLPGTVDRPAIDSQVTLVLAITLADEKPEPGADDTSPPVSPEQQLQKVFGIQLAGHGLLHEEDVTVKWIRPASPAARARPGGIAGLRMNPADVLDRLFQSEGVPLGFANGTPGFMVGDVITAINGQIVDSPPRAKQPDARRVVTKQLLDQAERYWKTSKNDEAPPAPIRVTVRRGLPSPFASHPRLDLFIGSMSPHKLSDFACTICHEGQGSATAFEWASHTPNDPEIRKRWHQQYGWFDNVHWPSPMHARRFIESTCLKCHHDVTELDASRRFPDPPAPKVIEGYRMVRKFGCFGCHEIDGFAGPGRRIGPDLRLEPNYCEAVLQLKGAPGTGYENLTDSEKNWVDQLIAEPERDEVRHKLLTMLIDDAHKATDVTPDTVLAAADAGTTDQELAQAKQKPRLSSYVHQTLLPLLKDREVPGTLRKAGPSLRFVREKLDKAFLFEWVRDPGQFRSSTQMPRFFGLWNHLTPQVLRHKKATLQRQLAMLEQTAGNEAKARVRHVRRELAGIDEELSGIDEVERRYEPLDIYSMVTYLLERSQAFDYSRPPSGLTPVRTEQDTQQQLERGKIAFQQRGCLACHKHKDFPEMENYRDTDSINRGPDLSDVGTKFSPRRNSNGPKWLYSWIKQPTRYDARTVMPDLLLDPVEHRDDADKITMVTDPAADIVAYLMASSTTDWKPSQTAILQLDKQHRQALRALTLEHLRDVFRETTARKFLEEGIPESRRHELQQAERELIVTSMDQARLTDARMDHKRLLYVARKSFAKHGCFGCHDIPGMEDAKPIGIALNDWGRKDATQLAFRHVVQYLTAPGDRGELRSAKRRETGKPGQNNDTRSNSNNELAGPEMPPPFYMQQLEAENRIGFIYQKLAEPRSYDFRVTETKRYNARLRMPQFPFSVEQREQIITFILGLVADPPVDKYVYRPDARANAVLRGNRVLDKFNCRGCHVLDAERWNIALEPDSFGAQSSLPTFPFLATHFTPQEMATSRAVDRRNLCRAVLEGMPFISDDGLPRVLDEEGLPFEADDEDPYELDYMMFAFGLWKPTLVDGHPYQVGQRPLSIPGEQIQRRIASHGGDLTKYLLPIVVRREKEVNSAAKGSEAWGWLPPPLVGEGSKVQPDWLHGYLLDPSLIRPAVAMRMPRFNMSSRDATRLVDYFAAKDGAEYPFEFNRRQRGAHLAQADAFHADRLIQLAGEGKLKLKGSPAGRHLTDAMRIVTDSNYCVKCHIIGDFDPVSSDLAKAPDLAQVHRRLRTENVRKWLARPTSILPHTSMPMNFTYDPEAPFLGATISQDLYHGTTLEQLDAVVDLLMNFDTYARRRALISPLVRPVTGEKAVERSRDSQRLGLGL